MGSPAVPSSTVSRRAITSGQEPAKSTAGSTPVPSRTSASVPRTTRTDRYSAPPLTKGS
jgi:hypothetical protein